MRSRTTAAFRKQFASLPENVRHQARAAYRVFASNPRHPSLHFKRIHHSEPIVAARVGRSYRVVGIVEDSDTVVWFWIGSHEQYETVISKR